MSKIKQQLCPKCREAMLNRIVLGKDSIESAVARMKVSMTSADAPDKPEPQDDAQQLGNLDLILPIDRMNVVMKAMKASGIRHHSEALVAICRFYLRHKEQ